MNHGEAAFKRGIERIFGRGLFRGGAVRDKEFRIFDVDVAEVHVPELIRRRGRSRELPVGESNVNLFDGDVQFVQDPTIGK